MSSDETQVISVKKQGLVGCILVLALLFSHIISSYYISKWMEFDSFGNPIFLHLIGMFIFCGGVILLEFIANKYELSILKIYICFFILNAICCFCVYVKFPYLYKNYPISFILFWIIPNLILNILIFLEFKKNSNEYNYQGLFLINFILIAISMILNHQTVYTELKLPTSDLPVTVSFATGVVFVVFTPMVLIFFNILSLGKIFNHDNRLHKHEFIYIILIFSISFLGLLVLNQKVNSGYIQYFLRNVAYEADFQFIPNYFKVVEFKKEGKAIQDILTNEKSTSRVRLHENGHISLMCIKKFRENSQLSKIYVFKYDDLAEFTYTDNQMVCRNTVLEQIMRDCQVEATP